MNIYMKLRIVCEGDKLARDWKPHEFVNCSRVEIPDKYANTERTDENEKELIAWLNAEYACPCGKHARAETKIIEILS